MIINAIITMTAITAQAEPRVHHYDPSKPANASIAAKNLQTDNDKISQIIAQNKTLDANQLEAIHEITYALEESQESLEGAGFDDAQMEQLEDAIKHLHNASEDHDSNATIEAYQAMQSELNAEDIAEKLQSLIKLGE